MAQPDIVFKHGRCSAAVFSKEVTKEGKSFQVRSVSFQKRYLDKNGEWQTSSYLDVNDLPKAALPVEQPANFTYEVVEMGVGREALTLERAALVARIAEIEALLG